MENKIRKYALQNALKYDGKANAKALIGRIMAEFADARKDPKATLKIISKIVADVNKLSLEKQKAELEKTAPELLEKKKIQEKDIFAFLNLDASKPIRTGFPPGPEKYPHIGHAKALLLNYLLAKKYNGKFILRFEDTNPNLVKKEFYKIMLENFKWLGVKPDELYHASDYMDLFYQYAEQLINEKKAYVCDCKSGIVKKTREQGKPCPCRDKPVEQNIEEWKNLPKLDENSSVLRLKIDMTHKNTTMRDPVIFRVISTEHPRQKKKYSVWPNYDFQNAIMDSENNITIRLRSKEFELRSELQRWIQTELRIKVTNTYEIARFNLKGVVSSGRVIREKVAKKELIGWDDPELTTIVALRRRGFLPEAIKNFVVSTGISKSESTLEWDDLIMHNKRLLDNTAKRFSAIFDSQKIKAKGTPTKKIELNLNPNEKKGGRKFEINENFILSKADIAKIKTGELFRLMDCINLKKTKTGFEFVSESYEDFKGKGDKIINWLPEDNNINIEVLMPNKEIKKAIAEKTISSLKIGDIIQFERFGFCRLDEKKKDKFIFWFTHS